ncbi:MAG: hypothetical protein LLF95_11415 [Bacteroidales bacterium]|nr:hypothetical protein [Bacteroidales bacterium]
MSKVYLIGAHVGAGTYRNNKARFIKPVNAQVICVSSVEDIPIEDRMQQIAEVHSLKARSIMDLPLIECANPDKRKSHERPYKFHR